jgi:type I restriction enzyme, R subunit
LSASARRSTGVDARNVRNIVLMRPINSMTEFKQKSDLFDVLGHEQT